MSEVISNEKINRSKLIKEYLAKNGVDTPAQQVIDGIGRSDIKVSLVNTVKFYMKQKADERERESALSGSQRIKEFLLKNGMDTPANDVVSALGGDVNVSLVNNVKSKMRNRRSKNRRNKEVMNDFEILVKVRDFAKELGGMEVLAKCVERLQKLL